MLSERKITRVDPIYQPGKDIIFLGESWCYGYYLAGCQETDPSGAKLDFQRANR
jgi:hypothetical protein